MITPRFQHVNYLWDDAAASKAPTAQVRTVNQCNLQQRKLVKGDQTRVHAANRCDLGGTPFIAGVSNTLLLGGLVVLGVAGYAAAGGFSSSP